MPNLEVKINGVVFSHSLNHDVMILEALGTLEDVSIRCYNADFKLENILTLLKDTFKDSYKILVTDWSGLSALIKFNDHSGFLSIQALTTKPYITYLCKGGEKEEVIKFLAALPKAPNKPYINVLKRSSGGSLELARIVMDSARELKEEFYNSKQLVRSLGIISDSLIATNPKGRLVIFSGPPGTGKTSLLHSFCSTEDAVVVTVTSNQIQLLQDPAFVDLLISTKAQYGKRILLLLEDADACLENRSTANSLMVQALLNLTDGLLSQTLGVFVIATTNLNALAFDPALLRPGRLLFHEEVGLLSAERATEASKIIGTNITFDRPVPLAAVFNQEAAAEVKVAKKRVGFV